MLGQIPFRGSVAVAGGLVSRSRLAGPGWRRLFPDVYVDGSVVPDGYTWCRAAALLLPAGAALSHESAAFLHGWICCRVARTGGSRRHGPPPRRT